MFLGCSIVSKLNLPVKTSRVGASLAAKVVEYTEQDGQIAMVKGQREKKKEEENVPIRLDDQLVQFRSTLFTVVS